MRIVKLFFCISIILIATGIYHTQKTLPANLHYKSPVYNLSSEDVTFLQDVTYTDESGKRLSVQEIFDEVFAMIDGAQEYILIDFFFYSPFTGTLDNSYRRLSQELTDKIIAKKKESPDITIQIVTDPINIMYGGHTSQEFKKLTIEGIPVIITDLRKLRDSNPLYSAFWRVALQWFGNDSIEGFLPNPLDVKSQKLGIRTYFTMLNYKANHRKIIMADYQDAENNIRFATLITSANPHDGSSAHSNSAFKVNAHIWKDILITESAVAKFSNKNFIQPSDETYQKVILNEQSDISDFQTQLLTEGAIKKRILKEINILKKGDSLDIAMFYISERDVIKALKRADRRKVNIRLLLDANKDAFGREKSGAPNRQVAHELIAHTNGSTSIRWCDTHGEQCHSKLLITQKGKTVVVMIGSANFTKRNLSDYNLETNLIVTGSLDSNLIDGVYNFFNTTWNNKEAAGEYYSVPYEAYKDASLFKRISYRVKEFTGVSRW